MPFSIPAPGPSGATSTSRSPRATETLIPSVPTRVGRSVELGGGDAGLAGREPDRYRGTAGWRPTQTVVVRHRHTARPNGAPPIAPRPGSVPTKPAAATPHPAERRSGRHVPGPVRTRPRGGLRSHAEGRWA